MPTLNRLGSGRIGAVLLIGVMASVSFSAFAADGPGSDLELHDKKAYWQTLYRDLLSERRTLRATVAKERELYADANRRNYRRGNKRHVHYEAMLEAQAELAEVEQKLSTIDDDARRAGALASWLYEVEDEETSQRPVVATGPGDEGRNPLYLDPPSD